MTAQSNTFKNRVKEYRTVRAGDLKAHPQNWRVHPERQRAAMRDMLTRVGWSDAILCYESPDGLRIIDGHLRSEMEPEDQVPVLVLDVTEDEAKMILASIDPLAALADKDEDVFKQLAAEIDLQETVLGSLIMDPEEEPAELTDFDTTPPPRMAWVLIGVPIQRYPEISDLVEGIAAIPDIICEVRASS